MMVKTFVRPIYIYILLSSGNHVYMAGMSKMIRSCFRTQPFIAHDCIISVSRDFFSRYILCILCLFRSLYNSHSHSHIYIHYNPFIMKCLGTMALLID